jgi:imidazoleglycerol-phosphate dehydratase
MASASQSRQGEVPRKTAETDIVLKITVDGKGVSKVSSGSGFMDHMLILFAKHGLFDLQLTCKGDTHVDFHHSAEDIGICLGQALSKALGERRGIRRYGTAYVPMDESLARVCCDLGGRSSLTYVVPLTDRVINDFECDLVEDFLKALCDNARMTLHVDLIRGRNSHHSIEAVFKALARALCEACSVNPRAPGELNTTKEVY